MSFKSAFTLALATVLWLGGCATRAPSQPDPVEGDEPAAVLEEREIERGQASWYGDPFHGRRTASGEIFNMHDLTAAHKTLPFGTRLRVRNLATGQDVLLRINDRGPHVRGRIIDLSRAAAAQVGLLGSGTATVVLLAE
ncbi:septal ring lytic transglycosylase RlpA family protein [Hydrogenophaga sp. PBL-H3]|uniref:septal ring lytic transglycosylase RlpA family protein n=1 Tax=Hydrogenophaga sp. PBL-H3 TaxID=434010 RepID=UPI001320543F|nr:septal ring lytic transglycosylase RlpA family protein [Hydrogenophaga sp. PBL-H3]QHE77872.1 septal ring lytic transglycosylase RlpA family protein [Hydrogenophaga sp. PBL-H3]QHE82296.1 septal ring lytic transglycosylase RlpA family protein [Hydrogenophaga sp. PBL-H3]